jgi:hypothetical protein
MVAEAFTSRHGQTLLVVACRLRTCDVVAADEAPSSIHHLSTIAPQHHQPLMRSAPVFFIDPWPLGC